jgi:protein PhnA
MAGPPWGRNARGMPLSQIAIHAAVENGDHARRFRRPGSRRMTTTPPCPLCRSDVTYEDGVNYVCAECAHEWPPAAEAAAHVDEDRVFRDSNGNTLVDGDTVVVIKDLKVKGASSTLKAGTKVKNIRLVDGDHDIDCRIDGFGAMKLKSEFVKKA